MVSIIDLGCYGMSGAHGPADDAESIATIRRALVLNLAQGDQKKPDYLKINPTARIPTLIDLGVNFLDTSASYGKGHNHRLSPLLRNALCASA